MGGRPSGRPPTRKVRMLSMTMFEGELYAAGSVYTLPKAIADSWVTYGQAEAVANDPKVRETKDA